MAIKFNHVTNTISFTSGACSASFVDSSATGIFETTGYARNCFVNTGQTGSLNYVKCPSSPSSGCVICYDGSNWIAGNSAGGGGGTTLPNGSTENSALCWNGSAWTTGQTYVSTGQTGNFNAFNSDIVNCNLNYKYDLNTVSNSTGSAVFQGNNNLITGQLNSQINNGSFNSVTELGCFNYIENGLNNSIVSGSCFSEILNGARNSISGGFYSSIGNGSGNLIRGGSSMSIINSLSSCISGLGGFANTILGGCNHIISSVSRSIVIGGLSNQICASSNDAVINGGRGNVTCGGVMSVMIGGNCNRLCHGAGTCTATGSIIIGGQQSAIVGSGCSVNFSTLINSVSGCISSGSFNTIINATCSCIVSGASNSVVIGSRNTISGYTGAIIIGSGITANANNTLFTNNLCAFGPLSINSVFETMAVCNTGSTGIINVDILSGSSIYNICNSTALWGLNLRGNANCTLNSLLPVNKSATISFLNTNGATAYNLTGVSIDGTSQTVRWVNGAGGFPTGNASLIDLYSITAIKTGNALYTIFGSTSYLKS
jgi:hypothetical protein